MRRRSFLIGSAALLAGAALRPPAFAAAPRNFASLPQGRIAYIDRGRGPVVLFLHGFPLSSFQWRDAIPRLSAYRRCLAPDWMGLGQTEVAPGQSVAPAAKRRAKVREAAARSADRSSPSPLSPAGLRDG